MTITVTTADGGKSSFEGTGWHVDDEGYLHVRASSGNAATFHRNHWVGVSK